MPTRTLYHATNDSAANSIDWEGFKPGSDGHQGGAIYLSDTIAEAKRRSRHGSAVVYEVRVNLPNIKSQWSYDGRSYAIYDSNLINSYSRR
jgi:hypothetical protein